MPSQTSESAGGHNTLKAEIHSFRIIALSLISAGAYLLSQGTNQNRATSVLMSNILTVGTLNPHPAL